MISTGVPEALESSQHAVLFLKGFWIHDSSQQYHARRLDHVGAGWHLDCSCL